MNAIREIAESVISRWWNAPFWDVLFPERTIYQRNMKAVDLGAAFIILAGLFSHSGYFLHPGGMIGFDWLHFWGAQIVQPIYPPWTSWLFPILSWNRLLGITLSGFSLLVYLRSRNPISALACFLCLPLFWVLLLGQIDGIVASGLLALPFLTPLVLVKPLVAPFALGAKRSYVIAAILTVMVSFVIFGYWPAHLPNISDTNNVRTAQQNIGLGGWWTLLALAGLWVSRGDMDMLMLSGIMAVPYLIPYHFIPVVPAVARLRPWAAVIAALISWLPFSANWVGPWGWWLGWVFPAWIWLNLAGQRYPKFFLFSRISPFL